MQLRKPAALYEFGLQLQREPALDLHPVRRILANKAHNLLSDVQNINNIPTADFARSNLRSTLPQDLTGLTYGTERHGQLSATIGNQASGVAVASNR
jgi:hypothetical protein